MDVNAPQRPIPTAYRVVIPARYGSTRFPGKSLATLAGRPLIEWVWRRARESAAQQIVVATDDERIASAARAFGAEVELTSTAHASGTDRIAEVARRRGWPMEAIIVNLQGDEPQVPARLLDQVADLLARHPSAAIATLATAITSLEEFFDTNAVKLVADEQGRALYFSRAPIPWSRDTAPSGLASQSAWTQSRRHLGLYAYRVRALLALADSSSSSLEELEKLEQLRALARGFEIRVADAEERPGADVNTPADLERAALSFGVAPR